MINHRLYTVFTVIALSWFAAMLVSQTMEQAFLLTELFGAAFFSQRNI